MEEETIELGQLCAKTHLVSKLVKSFNVMNWGEASENNLNPEKTKQPIAAE